MKMKGMPEVEDIYLVVGKVGDNGLRMAVLML
jgi:hypothetical protein